MASLRKNIAISALFTLFGGPGIVLAFIPWIVTRFRVPPREPFWQIVVFITAILAGLIPLLESICRFIVLGRGTLVPTHPAQHLVVTGLYSYVRNPMYVGVLFAIAAEAALFRSTGMLIEFGVVCLGFETFVRLYEEPRLARTFPAEYALYREHVRRWAPRLRSWRPPQA